MKRSIIAIALVLSACGSDSKDEKKQETVEIKPLSLDALELQSSANGTMCDFQKGFVHWFIPKYSPTLSIETEACGDSKSGTIPAEFEEINGKCKETCFVHVFTLKGADNKEFKLYSMVSDSETNTTGFLSQVEFGSFLLYDKPGLYAANDYKKNLSYSPDENLLRINLTFIDALKAAEAQKRHL